MSILVRCAVWCALGLSPVYVCMHDAGMHELTVAPETWAGRMTMREIDHFENRLMLKTLQEGLKHKVASVSITPNLVHGMCALRSVECSNIV